MTTAADISPEAVERMAQFLPIAHMQEELDKAAAMLRALRSALTDAQEIARRGDDIILGLEKTLDVARSSLTASEKDAARYRWLREQMHIAGAAIVEVLQPAGDWGNSVTAESPEGLDAAIDAAMEKANG